MSRNTLVKLRIPKQDLKDFGFFALNVTAATDWAQHLPVANTRAVGKQLHEVLHQLNRIELAPEVRFSILEALRPNALIAVSSLSKRFLNQPLVMPEEPRQIAALAEALYSELCSAYTIVAIQAIQQRDSIREKNPARLVCESIHRAIRMAGAKLLQTFQLYRPVEPMAWLTLHQLYALAESNKLTGLPVTDTLSGGGTITAAYLQALILGCSKPNQLRQADLSAVYRGLRGWCELLQVEQEAGECLFLVDLDNDQPPLYSALYSAPPGPRTRYIDTQPLVEQLGQLQANNHKSSIVLDKDTTISPNLLEHLISSLGNMSMRNFTRRASEKFIEISLGLSSTHYHLAGERNFEQLLYGDDFIPPPDKRLPSNPFLEAPKKGDLWHEANPEEDYSEPEFAPGESALEHEIDLDFATKAALEDIETDEQAEKERFSTYEVSLVDVSPGGYCFQWSAKLPVDIKTGDIVGVREYREASWVIAVIRWMSQLDQVKTLIGLELLSPEAMPYGARVQAKRGEEIEPTRVLLLPEIKLVGQPHTLITPRTGFKEQQKVTLMVQGEEFFIQLLRQSAITGSFAQFEFRYIKQLGEVLAEDKTRPQDSTYDSLWSNI